MVKFKSNFKKNELKPLFFEIVKNSKNQIMNKNNNFGIFVFIPDLRFLRGILPRSVTAS